MQGKGEELDALIRRISGESGGEMPKNDDEEREIKQQIAARLRARGVQWKQIGKVLGYAHGRSCAGTLKYDHMHDWLEIFSEALERRIQEDVEPTAIDAQLDLIKRCRGSDEREDKMVQTKAANSLLKHASTLRKQRLEITAVKEEKKDHDEQLIRDTRDQLDRIAISSVEEGESGVSEQGDGRGGGG